MKLKCLTKNIIRLCCKEYLQISPPGKQYPKNIQNQNVKMSMLIVDCRTVGT